MTATAKTKKSRDGGEPAATPVPRAPVALSSAWAPSPFTPIANYGFLSDCHTGALVAPDGSVDWLCVPRFDCASVFGALLDRGAGSFRLAPFGINVPSDRIYEPGTNSLVTSWRTPTGWAIVRDALTMGPRRGEDTITPHTRPPADEDAEHVLVRTARCIEGSVEIDLICEPVFDYGRVPAQWSLSTDRHRADTSHADQALRLQTDMLIGIEAGRARARHVLHAGDSAYCALSWDEAASVPTSCEEAFGQLESTTRFWRSWLAKARIPDHELGPLIQRSALTIKGLTYMPTGATVAADLERNDDGALQIMYGIDGRRDLTETVREDLSGYDGASPVRIGNGAFDQRQNDVFGAALDSVLLHSRRSQRIPRRLWPLVESQAECAIAVWREPDQGIWEARGKPRHYVSSKLMCWVALDRASKLAGIRADHALAGQWAQIAAEIKADILEHGVDKRGALRQHYETDALDASNLLAAIFGFLPGNDERLRATVLTIADELTEQGFVLRYRTDETDDGLSGKEGTFVICSFWLVSALAIIGEIARARDQMQRLVKVASPLGLYAEEFDTDTGRHLGNFPQAFSHLALVEAAARIIVAERMAEIGG
jgi:alpha,alpha-trehalase